jgi:hypothetical protein
MEQKPYISIDDQNKLRSPSPKNVKQNINPYTNINNKTTSSKLNISSSMSSIKKKGNQNKNYTLDSDNKNNKLLFDYQDEENKYYHIIATNVRIQNKILDEYQKWTNILLSVIDNKKINKNYNDIGTPIQQGLQHIEKLKNENLEIKTLIINKKIANERMEKILDKKRKTQNMVIKEYNEKDKSKGENIKKEKEQLILNVQMLANELDELNEYNKNLYDKIQNDENLKKIYDLIITKNKLKEENKLLKKIMVLKNRKNFIELKESMSFNNKEDLIDSYNNKNGKDGNNIGNEDYFSIGRFSGYGEYKLEKEENINTNDNAFFCGL